MKTIQAALAALVVCATVSGATIVLPSGYAGTPGGGQAPNWLGAGASTLQAVISSSLLGGMGIGTQLTGIQFRLASNFATGPAAATSWSDWSLTLGPSLNPAASLITTFASNEGPGSVVVRSGTLTLPANSMPGGAALNSFGFFIPFTTPYTYTGGDLLFTLTHTDGAGGSGVTVDYVFTSGVENQGGGGYQATSASFQQGASPIFELTTAIPEPSMFGALSIALTVLGLVRRRSSSPRSMARPEHISRNSSQ